MSRFVRAYSVACPYCGMGAGYPCSVSALGFRRAHYTHAARKRLVASLSPTPTNGAQP